MPEQTKATSKPPASNTATSDKLTAEFETLEFNALMGSYYHNARRAFLTNMHRIVMFSVILLGTAAMSDLTQGNEKILILISVVIATLDLVFSTSHKARDHDVLYSKFTSFLGELKSNDITAENIKQWQSDLHQIWASEPPVLEALQALSHNKVSIMQGKEKWVIKVNFWRRMFKNFFNFPNTVS